MKPLAALFALAALVLGDPVPDKTIGSKTAPTKIDLFLDLQCPPCKQLHDQTLPDVIANYADKGKVFIVLHDFPIPQLHKHAMEAAHWANAAKSVHKYQQVANAFFASQEKWATSGDLRSVVAATVTPAELKIVESHLKDPSIDTGIDADHALGVEMGLRATPTVIVSHKLQTYPFSGFVSYSILRQALDDINKK